jgi:aryl-alcohol dehydrogenase-like predicted oxidoreductase
MTNARIPSLSEYALLGRSGLRVSPLCLGTMTFGTEWGWGAPKESAHRLLERYLEAGGNFIDTADGYTGGSSESILGEWFAASGRRDEVVLATKFTFNGRPGDPNAGGNGRKNVFRALEGSLRRLRTDYVDLYWLHAWDGLTPVEEVMSTLDALVRSGKVRYIGLSDVPAWYLARAQTIAEHRGLERVAALQLEYSLVERNIEREHVPAAIELGMGICPWSPLASGLLTGKYTKEGVAARGTGRLAAIQGSGNPAFEKLFTERNWAIVDALLSVAHELDKKPAEVALAWITRRPGVSSTIVGATQLEQLDANLRALELEIPPELGAKLDAASRPEAVHPYIFFDRAMQTMISGGTTVRAEQRWYRPRG